MVRPWLFNMQWSDTVDYDMTVGEYHESVTFSKITFPTLCHVAQCTIQLRICAKYSWRMK